MTSPSRLLMISLLASASFITPALALDGEQEGDLRLELSRVQVYAEQGKLNEASALVERLKAQYPNNPQVRVAEADLALRTGNRGAGLKRLSEAQRLDPDNPDITRRSEEVRVQQPYASVDREMKETGSLALEQFTRATARVRFSEATSLGIAAENNRARIDSVTRTNGTTSRFDGDRQRYTVTATQALGESSEAEVSAFFTEETAGAGAAYTWLDEQGSTRLEGRYQYPEWDYLEGVVEYGTRDEVSVMRTQYLSPRWQGHLGGGYRRYGLDDDESLAQAGAVAAELSYIVPSEWYQVGEMPSSTATVQLNYTLDAEYFGNVESRVGSTGVRFRPLPVSSYEVHALTASFTKELFEALSFDAYAGYAFDRLGEEGPQFGAFLSYAPVENLTLQLRAARGISGERDSDRVDRLGANVAWRF